MLINFLYYIQARTFIRYRTLIFFNAKFRPGCLFATALLFETQEYVSSTTKLCYCDASISFQFVSTCMRIQIVLFYKLLYEIDLNMKQNTFLKLLYCDLWKRCRSHVNQGAQVDRRALPIHDTPQTTCNRSIDLSHVESKCILHW